MTQPPLSDPDPDAARRHAVSASPHPQLRSVTQREYHFPAEDTLLSATDLTSRIVYANAAFVRTSGYDCEELLHQPHNLVRHPDMPREAFADMWNSLKQGHSWSALVKNRRKDGDHYWVRANATPMRRNGRVTGYLSVRTQPSRDEVATAEALYRRFREGRAKGLAFRRGLIVHTGWQAWRSLMQVMSTRCRVQLPLALCALPTLAMLALAWTETAPLSAEALTGFASLQLLCLLGAYGFIHAQLVKPLGRIAAVAQAVASGEPGDELRWNRCDDIGALMRAVRQAGLNLRSLVDDVQTQTSGISTASQEIAAASLDLSSRTEQSAANLQQTASSMEEMTATVRNNAESAREASRLSDAASHIAAQGGEAVSQVVATMAQISESSRRIADITAVIDGIAFQTNILALNAAVEAARAGEQGRGFAVVAQEVRSLAQRSAEAARDIKSLIASSAEKVDSGSRAVDGAGRTITGVVGEVRRVNQLIADITSASSQQSDGIAQVSQAVNHLDSLTQQNAAMVEQSSAAARGLQDRTRRLVQAVEVFSMGARR